jgi:restriction endonuclease S subunit
MKLFELCSIRNGLTYSGKVYKKTSSDLVNFLIPIIQFKDLNPGNYVETSNLGFIPKEDIKHGQILNPSDLVFRSRSLANFALLVPDSLSESVLASPLFSIRVQNRNMVFPAYLQWFINQTETQKKIRGMVQDSGQPMINKRDFENLEIVLPPMEVQRKILEISNLSAREIILLDEIKRKKELFISSYLMQYAKERIQ